MRARSLALAVVSLAGLTAAFALPVVSTPAPATAGTCEHPESATCHPESATCQPESATHPPESATYRVDPGHSVVLFRTRHLGLSYFHGRFDEVGGEVVYDAEHPERSSVTITVRADSVDTNSDDRDAHLRSPDFFSAKEFPKITFESSAVESTKDGLEVTGALSFHGVTKTITIAVDRVGEGSSPFGDYRMGFETVFEIDPRDYGVRYMQDPKMLGPGVRLTVALECIREP